jgi:type II secretory pathway pseudopilin PulG
MNNKGFTFVEIMISIGLAAIMLPALAQALSFSIRVASQGEKFTQAYSLAQKEMETAYAQKSKDWNSLVDSGSTGFPYTLGVTITGVKRCGTKPNLVICNDLSKPDDLDTKKITVTVSWHEAGGDQIIKLESYVTRH